MSGRTKYGAGWICSRRNGVHAGVLLRAFATGLLLLGLVTPAAAQDFDLAGTQPIDPLAGHDPPLEIEHLFIPPLGSVPFGKACIQCHDAGAGEPYLPWQGSMMAHAARDPLFYAQLDLANADGAARPAVAGMGDMCLRCHSPVGWLEGRSSNLTGMSLLEKDLFGVQCHFCHRLVDPLTLAADPADIHAALDAEGLVPPTFGNGMFVVDPKQVRRGPFGTGELTNADHLAQLVETTGDWNAVGTGLDDHPVFDSAFHRSGNLCGTCHDVSNPADCPPGVEKTDVQQCFPIERTWTEWSHSKFATEGEAGNCQSCHMSGPHNGVGFGAVCEGGTDDGHLNDIHVHDLTGGNAVVPMMILAMKERYDDCVALGVACSTGEQSFVAAVNALYPPAGSSPFTGVDEQALAQGAERAVRTLERSATLEVTSVAPELTLEVTNLTGHKLPTGYPEGRRMWMNVKFIAANGSLAGESGEYDASTATLFHDQNVDGAAGGVVPHDVLEYTDGAGGGATVPGSSRPTKVWEARSHWDASDCVLPDPADCPTEFHFVLNNQRVMDNRIPPEGWTPATFTTGRAEPVIPATYQSAGWQWDYLDAGTPVHYDRFSYPLIAGTDRVRLTLNYQTASREYIEALRDDNPGTLTAGGYNRGTLLHEIWEQTGRSAPVPLISRVQAIVDADTDELADGWESEHGLGEPGCAGAGYNDDPDGDGLSNWQELQLDHHPTLLADPCDPNLPSAEPPRTPVDVILVLDRSGSMLDPAPVTGKQKMELLRESVELFLETWRDHATPNDRIGLVYFGDQAEVFGGTLLHPFFDTWEAIRDDVFAKPPSGWTAMGAALHLAMEPLKNPVTQELLHDPANPRNRHLILFSNGMQNRSPMVTWDVEFPEFLVVRDQTATENPDVTGASNVVIGADLFSAFPLSPHTLHVHTIGIGVVQNSGGEGWHTLLQALAVQQNGKHNFITDARQLEGVFLEDLVASLRGETLEYVLEEELTLDGTGTEELAVPVNPSAKKLSLVVSWRDQKSPPPRIELLRPDGRPEDLRLISRGGESYRIVTRFLDRRTGDPGEVGVWKLRLAHPRQREPGVQDVDRQVRVVPLTVRVHALLDDSELEYDFSVPRDLRLGDDFKVASLVIENDRPLRWMDSVIVTVRRPGVSLGERLARSRHRLDDAVAIDPDAGSSPFQRKLLAAYRDPGFVARLTPQVQTLDLLDDGTSGDTTPRDGVFSRLLPTPTVPGHYELHFRIAGHSATGQRFVREETRSLVVRIGPIAGEESDVGRVSPGGIAYVRFTPRDAAGNLLGPGWTSQLLVLTADGRQLGVEDLLDGSYRAPLPSDLEPDAPVSVSLGDETIHQGPLPQGGFGRGCSLAIVLLLLLLLVVVALILFLRRPIAP